MIQGYKDLLDVVEVRRIYKLYIRDLRKVNYQPSSRKEDLRVWIAKDAETCNWWNTGVLLAILELAQEQQPDQQG